MVLSALMPFKITILVQCNASNMTDFRFNNVASSDDVDILQRRDWRKLVIATKKIIF